jgi:hypothetical protein
MPNFSNVCMNNSDIVDSKLKISSTSSKMYYSTQGTLSCSILLLLCLLRLSNNWMWWRTVHWQCNGCPTHCNQPLSVCYFSTGTGVAKVVRVWWWYIGGKGISSVDCSFKCEVSVFGIMHPWDLNLEGSIHTGHIASNKQQHLQPSSNFRQSLFLKVEVKLSLSMPQRNIREVQVQFQSLILSTRWWWVVTFMHRATYPWDKWLWYPLVRSAKFSLQGWTHQIYQSVAQSLFWPHYPGY